jgi:hypothetical protein
MIRISAPDFGIPEAAIGCMEIIVSCLLISGSPGRDDDNAKYRKLL